jgi:hypothetical protein
VVAQQHGVHSIDEVHDAGDVHGIRHVHDVEAIAAITRSLVHEFADRDASPAFVHRVVEQQYVRFAGARIRSYVPALVARGAREQLRVALAQRATT